MISKLEKQIKDVLKDLGVEGIDFVIEHPTDMAHGDYACNAAMVAAKSTGENPRELAEKIAEGLEGKIEEVEKIEVAGPGFINFYLKSEFFIQNLKLIDKDYGKNDSWKGKKVLVEYIQPNPFKEFHIGHLMGATIGEFLARIYEVNGAEVLRLNYQGDVGMHVAKAIWGMQTLGNTDDVESLGKAYATGAQAYESDDNAKQEINEINKKVYSREDDEINDLYDKGRKISLDYFEEVYAELGTKFDDYFFESETGKTGLDLISENKDIFKDSEGAVVFAGEDHGLHTRVFVNSEGLPTYEAKELGLNKTKFEKFSPDLSIVETGNEINDYFRVLLKVMELIMPEVAKVTRHIGHGMLRLPEGKMSSRTGDVVTTRSMIGALKEKVTEKMEEQNDETAEQVAIGAIKYSILKQAPGKDVIFDFEKSLSFEGSSGPYLQYTRARSLSLLEKGREAGLSTNLISDVGVGLPAQTGETEKLLQRFPEVVESAMIDSAPQHVVTYLTELASSFNTFYGQNKIIDEAEKEVSEHRLAITEAVAQVLENGLWILGIEAPDRM